MSTLDPLPISLATRETYQNSNIPLVTIPSALVDPSNTSGGTLLNAPQGQKICAGWKKRVYLYRDYIIKGPYLSEKPGDMIFLDRNINNTEAIQLFEDMLKLPEDYRVTLPWAAILKTDHSPTRYYLVQKNVGETTYQQTPLEELQDSKLNRDQLITKPGSSIHTVQTLADKSKGGNPEKITPEIALHSLQYLYFRYILGIGDVTLRNILVRSDVSPTQPRVIAGVDMEEYPDKVLTGDRLHLLLPKSTQQPILKKIVPYLDKIKYFKGELPSKLQDMLANLGFDTKRIQERIRVYELAH